MVSSAEVTPSTVILPVEVVVSDPAAVIIEASAPSTVTALVKFEVIPAEPALTVTLDPTEVSACVISMELPLESMSTLLARVRSPVPSESESEFRVMAPDPVKSSFIVIPLTAFRVIAPEAMIPPVVASSVIAPPELAVSVTPEAIVRVPVEILSKSPSKVIFPVVVRSPLIVSPLSALAVKSPPSVEAANIRVLLSVICTAPVPDDKVTAPVKVLAWVKVMALLPDTVKLEVPATERTPVCVIAPLEVTVRLPLKVDAARIVSEESVN